MSITRKRQWGKTAKFFWKKTTTTTTPIQVQFLALRMCIETLIIHSIDSEISDMSETTHSPLLDETLTDRLIALRDIIPPKTRARISNAANTVFNASSTGITYGGKGLWVIATSVLLLGLPYMLAVGQEQELMEEERQRTMMMEGASGIMQPDGSANERVQPTL